MYLHLLLFTLLLTLVSSQDIAPLTAQLPPCMIPCLQNLIGEGCPTDNDWSCGCQLNSLSYNNFGCATAIDECTSYEIVDAQSLIDQICALESSSPTTAPGLPVQTSVPGSTLPTSAPVESTSPSTSPRPQTASETSGAASGDWIMTVGCLAASAVWIMAGVTYF